MPECEHKSVRFPLYDTEELKAVQKHFTSEQIKEAWPRFFGKCSCGFNGIAYASYAHYIFGDW